MRRMASGSSPLGSKRSKRRAGLPSGCANTARARARAPPDAMTHVRPGSSKREAGTGGRSARAGGPSLRTSSRTRPLGPGAQSGWPSASTSVAGSTSARTPRTTTMTSPAASPGAVASGRTPTIDLFGVFHGVERARLRDDPALLAHEIDRAAQEGPVHAGPSGAPSGRPPPGAPASYR